MKGQGVQLNRMLFSHSFLCALRPGHGSLCLHHVLSFTQVPGLPASPRAARASAEDWGGAAQQVPPGPGPMRACCSPSSLLLTFLPGPSCPKGRRKRNKSKANKTLGFPGHQSCSEYISPGKFSGWSPVSHMQIQVLGYSCPLSFVSCIIPHVRD